jgi:DNA invertase Pin-like site-specific DNA recombinase
MIDSTKAAPKAYSYLRMSTDVQLKGHSKQRQLEESKRYAKAHGLELADEAQLEDVGISAFKGANVNEGALGQFLDAVKSGKVPTGSYLLVESLDRLSRQEILPSLTLLLTIIAAGIKLVTLQDERVYDQRSRADDLIISLTIMSRAHEESQLKSQRVGAAWANKRANARQRKLTKWCPAWLRLSADRREYQVISERAAVVRSIFDDTVAGIGGLAITKRLNARKMPMMGKTGWHPSYIAKILTNRAVIGEFQPHKLSAAGKRKPEGPPIKNYFPQIIDKALFYRAQKARSERRNTGRGRKGTYVTNLFSGVAKCAYCRRPMIFENKGPLPKGGTFLVCEGAKRGLKCIPTRWRYDHFESSFLAFVEQLDLPNLMANESSKQAELDQTIDALRGEQISLREEMERAYQLLKLNSSLEIVAEKLGGLQKRFEEVSAQLNQKEEEKQNLTASERDFYQSKVEIKSLITRLQTPGDEDLYKLRSQVAARIKALVKALNVAPLGEAPRSEMLWRDMERMAESPEELVEIEELKKTVVDSRYFGVGFANGQTLHIHPNKDDPLKFDWKTVDLMTSYGPDGKLVPPPKPRSPRQLKESPKDS